MDTSYDRRTVLKLFGLGAGAAALAACGGGSGGGTAKKFDFASWSLADEVSKAGVQNLIDEYAKAEKVTIKGVPITYPEYVSQLTLKIRSNQFTGAAQIDIATLSGFAALGKLVDLGPQAKGAGYTDTALTTGQLDGKQLALPWTTAAIGMIANTELLGKVGAKELPTTITEFEDLLTELKKAKTIPYAASTKVAQLKDALIWMETFGSPLIDGDTVTIGDDASVEAVTWYKSLLDKGLIAPDVERDDARLLFAQGKTAMFDDALVIKDVVVKSAPDKDLADKMAPFGRPVVKDGDKPRAQQWGHAIMVVESDASETAADFARWTTSDQEAVLSFFADVSLPPTTEKGLAAEAVAKDTFTTQFTERITATATPNPFWRFPQYAQMETAVAERVQAALIGKESPKEAMTKAKKAVQELM